MRFISFASNIGPAAAVPAGPAPSPLVQPSINYCNILAGKGTYIVGMHLTLRDNYHNWVFESGTTIKL